MACRSSFVENSGTENVDRRNELFIGGSTLKLRQGASQSSVITVDMEDPCRKRTVTGDARIVGKQAGGPRRGSAHNYIPWSRRDSFGGGSRPPSLLERSLIPSLKKNVRLPFPSYGAVETAQMTIFYAGNVNVYENVPADKAFGVMVLANQCSVAQPDPIVQEQVQEQDHATTQGLPLARQQSLRRFLEKRRDRLINKFPYAKLDDK